MQWAIRGEGINWEIIPGQQTHDQSVPESPIVPKKHHIKKGFL